MDLKQYIQELKKVVNIDCGTATIDGVEEVSRIIQQWYQNENWHCDKVSLGEKVGPGLFATNKPDAEYYDVLLVGHMDTVFPEGTVAERPFRIEGNRAYGPGVSDMKSGLLNILWALREMDKATLERLSIGVAMNPDEETSSLHSRHWLGELAKRSRCVLVCEAARADGSLVKARKGIAGYKLTFKGVAAHAGNDPESGRSAIKALAHAVLEISELADISKGTTINTGVISGGVVANIVPEHAEMIVDVRFQDNEEYARVHAAIQAYNQHEFERDVKTTVHQLTQKPAMSPTADTEVLMKLIEQAGAAEGIDVRWKSVGGGSDANYIAALGVPALDGLGPIGAGFHSASEYLELDSIEPRIRLLKRVIQSL
ncbi:M20 family metallopeptidase [Buttiauxella sp. B2]|uniref:M20 family metallopeptidase n=1 Tax=Buttiauxella sp. B2 TaxID=2587812 RepID=UPI0011233D7D|nr:M20 family metallopeptidase [Buttiauxella sp. B2]TNV17324.1 M20 family metallopeptidase [Buttiauxella sp. B2]